MDNLTPKLTDQQIRENIDTLFKGGMQFDQVQQYVNNYTRDANGDYVLKTQESKPLETPGYVKRVATDYKQGAEDITQGIEKGAQKYQEGVDQANKAQSFEDALAGIFKSTAGLGKAGLRTVGTVAKEAFVPATEAIEPVAKPLMEKASEIPGVKTGVEHINAWAEKHPEAAKDLQNVFDIVTLGGGAAVEQPVKEGVKDIAKTTYKGIKEDIGKVAEGNLEKTAQKQVEIAHNAIKPTPSDFSPTEYEDLLKKQRFTPNTKLKPSEYILSDNEKRVAEKYKDLLQDKNPVKNNNNVMNEIINKDSQVGDFLRQNNAIYNDAELRNYLRKKLEGVTDVVIGDKQVTKLKNNVIDNFIKSIPKNDMENLWKNRKEFDSKIESAFSGSPSLQKSVKTELRNGVQDFIADRTPEGVYKGYMKDMRELYSIQDNLALKATKGRGLTEIQTWIKNNPTKAKAIKTVLGGTVAYELFRKLGIIH